MSRGNIKGKTSIHHFFDYTLLTVVLFLLCIGLVVLYSVSSYDANLTFGDSAHYIKKQFFATIVGLIAMFVVMQIDYHFFERFAFISYVVSIILIVLVLSPLGVEANGARRWLDLGISLQPAEVAKVGVILFSASLVCKLNKNINTLKGTAMLAIFVLIQSILIFIITDNLSSAIIVLGIGFSMYFVATTNYSIFALIVFGGSLIAGIFVLLVSKGILTEEMSYRYGRIRAWLYPEAYSSTTAFQTLQALYAIGSGGVFGKGLGTSLQKQFVPEAQNDMIFSIICEELGVFGAIAILALFVIMIMRFFAIANMAKDAYGAMIVIGVLAHIAIQVILNIAVVTNTIPNTGISLPFISYGGSSVVFLLIEIGMVLSVARSITYEE